MNYLLAKAKIPKVPKFDNVARMPAPDPRDITLVYEEWFERRSKFKKGHQVWKFYSHKLSKKVFNKFSYLKIKACTISIWKDVRMESIWATI
jgi:hypothetical protein